MALDSKSDRWYIRKWFSLDTWKCTSKAKSWPWKHCVPSYPSLLFKVTATQFHVNTRLKATQQLLFLFFWVDFDGFFMLLLIPKLKNQSKSSISKWGLRRSTNGRKKLFEQIYQVFSVTNKIWNYWQGALL